MQNRIVQLVNFVGAVVCVVALYASLSLVTQSTANAVPIAANQCSTQRCFIDPGATLDTSQIDDLRGTWAVSVSSPASGLDDNLEADTAAEGHDTWMTLPDDVPSYVWDALLDAGYVGIADDDCECLYVEIGTTVHAPGESFLVTYDGWMGCADFETFDGECSSTGPMLPL